VSFFALLSQQRAQSEASKIRVGNEVAHVETVMRSGVPVYRVILGPYPTCAEAQRTAKASGTTAWIPEGGLSGAFRQTMSHWLAEGRKLGASLRRFTCIVVAGPDADATADVALGIAEAQAG